MSPEKAAVVRVAKAAQGVVDALEELGRAWDALAAARLAARPNVDDAWSLPVPWPLPKDWESTTNQLRAWALAMSWPGA